MPDPAQAPLPPPRAARTFGRDAGRRSSSGGGRLALIAVVLLGGYALARYAERKNSVPSGAALANALPQVAYVKERQWTDAVRAAVKESVAVPSPTPVAAPNNQANAKPTSPVAADPSNSHPPPPPLQGLSVLCAEISPTAAISLSADANASSSPHSFLLTHPAGLDWTLLATLPKPVSLLIRVRAGNSTNKNSEPAAALQREPFPTLRRALDETLAQAAAAGLHPKEIQIQLDNPAASPGLAGFGAWLTALRSAFPAQSFCPVIRPSLLSSPDFAAFAKSAGTLILDLQGLERTGGDADAGATGRRVPETLCDPTAAVEVVKNAGRLGIPFRVALPDSGVRLIFDSAGRLQAMTTEPRNAAPATQERTTRAMPPGGSERILRANPTDMADLVAALNAKHPATLQGILWDRLPIEENKNINALTAANDDSLDWPPATFRAVRAGRIPRAQLEWQFPAPTEGSDRRELALHNRGEAEGPLPPLLTVRCPQPPITAEAAGPYELVPRTPKEHLSPREVRFRLSSTPSSAATADSSPASPMLAPGATLLFGIVRVPLEPDPNAPTTDELGGNMEDSASPAPTP